MSLVSVIIPTYRHAEFVLQTLESVWAQTYTDYEVIVINDGSPDNTAEVLRPLAAGGRIRYFEQSNSGQAAARNRGLAEARGEWIALLDDDDLWPSDKLQWQTDYLKAHQDVGLIGGTSIYFTTTPPSIEPSTGKASNIEFEELFDGAPFHSPGQTLIRASQLKKIQGFNTSIWGADDLDLYMRLARECRVVKCDRPSLYYRLHAQNASRNSKRMLANSREVIRQNLPFVSETKRKQIEALSWRWMYRYIGRKTVREIKADLREWKLGEAAHRLQIISPFFARLARQPELARTMFNDIKPVRWRQ